MINAKLKLDVDGMADNLSDRVLELISESEELKKLSPQEVVELSNIVNHSIRLELDIISELDLVTR